MSFLKDLFEKRKDKKYGKGHRLGDTTTPRNESAERPATASLSASYSTQSEAAKRAGEAALARQISATKPANRPTTSNASRQALKDEIESTNKEIQKAMDLKDHYFGKPITVENVSTVGKIKIFYKASILRPGERYTLSEIEDKIEQCLLQQLDEEPILVSVSLLFTANYRNQEKLDKCVEILNKFVDNILKFPNEEKYRKIRLENPIFKEKVYSCKYADMVVKQAGFKGVSIKKENEDGEEIYFIYEGDKLEKLESLKTALSLAEPILPELDRDIRVFNASSNSSKLNDFNLGEEFFNLKIEELRREQQLRNEAIEKAGMLRTKAMRERDEHIELRRYNYSMIRVKFPDNFILQAMFKSNEKYEEVLKVVSNSLEMESLPFDLVGHSMKKPPNNPAPLGSFTLAELGLAPSALLNFKLGESVDDWIRSNLKFYLKTDLLQKAENF